MDGGTMRLSAFIMAAFSIKSVYGSLQVSDASDYVDLYRGKYTKGPEFLALSANEKDKIVSMLNINRNAAQASMMMKLKWNNTCEDELEKLASKYGRDWFFEQIPNVTRLGSRNGPTLRVTYLDTYQEFNSKLPGFISLFRDTGNIRPNPISQWLKFRNNQAHCCDMDKKCSSVSFSNFESCCKIDLQTSKPCSWAADYLPREYIDNMQEICGIVLNRPGPFTPYPKKQKQVGFLYAKMTLPKQDLMYEKNGDPCSKCPPQTQCVCAVKTRSCKPALCS
jgi:hypothetical protein